MTLQPLPLGAGATFPLCAAGRVAGIGTLLGQPLDSGHSWVWKAICLASSGVISIMLGLCLKHNLLSFFLFWVLPPQSFIGFSWEHFFNQILISGSASEECDLQLLGRTKQKSWSIPEVPLMQAMNIFLQSQVSQQKGPLNLSSLLCLNWVDQITSSGGRQVTF